MQTEGRASAKVLRLPWLGVPEEWRTRRKTFPATPRFPFF